MQTNVITRSTPDVLSKFHNLFGIKAYYDIITRLKLTHTPEFYKIGLPFLNQISPNFENAIEYIVDLINNTNVTTIVANEVGPNIETNDLILNIANTSKLENIDAAVSIDIATKIVAKSPKLKKLTILVHNKDDQMEVAELIKKYPQIQFKMENLN